MIKNVKRITAKWCKKAGLALAVGSFVSACLLYPNHPKSSLSNKNIPTTSSFFRHKDHEEVLKKEKFRCTDCHLYDVEYLQREKKLNDELANSLTEAGMESCHYCHVKHPDRGGKNSLKCMNCHVDLLSIRPGDHTVGWKEAHGTSIELSKVACNQCHSNRSCVRCHMTRDPAAPVVHSGVMIVSHPVRARSNPNSCKTCHQPVFCVRCHRGRF